jgi:hypothetical protein
MVAYDAATQVQHSTWLFSSPDDPRIAEITLALRCVFPEELPLLLAAAGWRLDERLGAFDGARFVSASAHQICRCTPSTPSTPA